MNHLSPHVFVIAPLKISVDFDHLRCKLKNKVFTYTPIKQTR